MGCEHCSSPRCVSCQEHSQPQLSLKDKIVGAIIGLVFFFHILALRKLAEFKIKKEYIKIMNDPKKRKELVEQFMKTALEAAMRDIPQETGGFDE